MITRMFLRTLSVLCLLGVLSVGLGADTRAIMSLVGATDSSLNLKVLAVATSGVAGDTRAIGSLVGATDSAGNLKVTLDAASVISGANFLANTSGTCVTPRYSVTGDTDTGIGYLGANNAAGCANGATIFDWNASRVLFAQPINSAGGNVDGSTSAGYLLFGSGSPVQFGIRSATNQLLISTSGSLNWTDGAPTGNVTLSLFQDAANTLAQRNGTNAQIFNIYNTFTSATNYERVGFNWSQSANRFRIESVKGSGGGTARPIDFTDGASAILTIDPVAANVGSRTLLALSDNTYDFGALGASRFRTGYFGTSVVSPVVNATTGYQVSGVSQIVNVASNFTTANNTNLQTITGLTWQLPASTALNMPFSCKLEWSQATAAVVVSFGLQTDTVTPTNFLGLGQMETNLTVTSYGDVAIANTTATVVVTGTPAATATTYNAYIDGFIENPSNGSTTNVNVMVKTATGADAVTVYRGSYCRAF